MERYLMTHSLLSSWLYAMKSSLYETERDSFEEFLKVLRREPTETTEAMRNGLAFEDEERRKKGKASSREMHLRQTGNCCKK